MPGSLSAGEGSPAPQPDTPPSKRVRRQGEDGSPERRGLSAGAADGTAAGAVAGDGAHSEDKAAMDRWVLLLLLWLLALGLDSLWDGCSLLNPGLRICSVYYNDVSYAFFIINWTPHPVLKCVVLFAQSHLLVDVDPPQTYRAQLSTRYCCAAVRCVRYIDHVTIPVGTIRTTVRTQKVPEVPSITVFFCIERGHTDTIIGPRCVQTVSTKKEKTSNKSV